MTSHVGKEPTCRCEISTPDVAGEALHEQSKKRWKIKNAPSSRITRSHTCAFIFLLSALIDVEMPGYVEAAT